MDLPENLLNILKNGEKIDVELKTSKNKLPSTLFETVCAFLNRNGGHIFLGVDDSKKIVGINPEKINDLKKDFTNLCNNSQKIFPTVQLFIKEYNYEDKRILYINVYESSEVHRSNNKIFDRNEDGDYDITNNTALISQMYSRKSSTYAENEIFEYATLEDLRKDVIAKVRQMAVNKNANHPWQYMNDLELLRSASLYEKDFHTNKEGVNLAGILLFGKDEVIKSVRSFYKTDALYRENDTDGYIDRDDVRTNLIDSYFRLTSFVKKHMDDKFYLENGERVSPSDKIARELCANILIHRDYTNPFPAKVIISKDKIISGNANRSKMIRYIDLTSYTPYPKNPKIAAVFKEIGFADELGSGIQRITEFSKLYSNIPPKFKEDDIFETTIYLSSKITTRKSKILTGHKKVLYDFICSNNGVSRHQINDYVYPLYESKNIKELNNKVRYLLTKLKNENLIKNVGSDTKPLWIKK